MRSLREMFCRSPKAKQRKWVKQWLLRRAAVNGDTSLLEAGLDIKKMLSMEVFTLIQNVDCSSFFHFLKNMEI